MAVVGRATHWISVYYYQLTATPVLQRSCGGHNLQLFHGNGNTSIIVEAGGLGAELFLTLAQAYGMLQATRTVCDVSFIMHRRGTSRTTLPVLQGKLERTRCH